DNPLADEVAARIQRALPPGRPVLELGAGTGLITRRLVAGGFAVSASEPEPHMRRRLRARLPGVALTSQRCEDVRAGAEAGSVVAVNGVHMTSDPLLAIGTLRAAAGPGGVAVVVAPHANATLPAVARALHDAGCSKAVVARFLGLHALLAPLTVAAGIGL